MRLTIGHTPEKCKSKTAADEQDAREQELSYRNLWLFGAKPADPANKPRTWFRAWV